LPDEPENERGKQRNVRERKPAQSARVHDTGSPDAARNRAMSASRLQLFS
jgi:hypothetical protein